MSDEGRDRPDLGYDRNAKVKRQLKVTKYLTFPEHLTVNVVLHLFYIILLKVHNKLALTSLFYRFRSLGVDELSWFPNLHRQCRS